MLALLEPFAGLLMTGFGGTVDGAADRARGHLLAVLGRHDEADTAYAAAVALEDGFGAPALAAETKRWWAECLMERGAPGDRDRAAALVEESLAFARARGLGRVEREAGALQDRLHAVP